MLELTLAFGNTVVTTELPDCHRQSFLDKSIFYEKKDKTIPL